MLPSACFTEPSMPALDTPQALLGIDNPGGASTVLLHRLVTDGLPVGAVNVLAGHLAPMDRAFRYRLVPRATLARRRRSAMGKLLPEEGDRVMRVATTLSVALGIYRELGLARAFLGQPHPMLDNQVPLELALASGAGAAAVITLLQRAAYGGGV